MAYETTQVPVGNSQSEIRKLLTKHGATGIAFVSQPPMEGFEAMVPIGEVTYRVRMSANIPFKCKDPNMEMRRLWRVLFYHLKSVFEAASTGVLEFREMMLPYIVVKDGRTVGEHMLPQLEQAVDGKSVKMLGWKD